jgi:hypothetical protein
MQRCLSQWLGSVRKPTQANRDSRLKCSSWKKAAPLPIGPTSHTACSAAFFCFMGGIRVFRGRALEVIRARSGSHAGRSAFVSVLPGPFQIVDDALEEFFGDCTPEFWIGHDFIVQQQA